MTFYRECLGGELTLQTVGELPAGCQLPPGMGRSILHAMLVKEELVIMASDMVAEAGLIQGNAVALMLNCSSEEEIRTFYARLSKGGRSLHPPEDTHWGALFGDLIDRYGYHWLLNYAKDA